MLATMERRSPRGARTPGGTPDTCCGGIEMAERTCSVPGCAKPWIARSLCGAHYQAANKNNSLPPRRSALDRFWEKVEKTDTCWLWTGTTSKGYGQFKFNGKMVLAHRFSYELLTPVPAGMQLDHLCRVRRCVNPAHLEPVSCSENIIRGRRDKTHCKNGHPLAGRNLIVDRRGRRSCRTCKSKRAAERYQLRKMEGRR